MRLLAAVLILGSTAVSAQTIYRWTDKKGEVHYTDDLSTVPKGAKLETTEGEELMVEPPRPTPAPAPPTQGGALKRTVEIDLGNGVKRTIELSGTMKAPAPKKQSGPVEVKLTQVRVEVSEGDRKYIEDSLRTAAASPRLTTWGGLRESVEVEITPAEVMRGYAGTDAFGRAIGTNKMQLRAPKDVRSMGFALDYSGTALHELAHLLEHQLAVGSSPAWFAEGFACVLSEQVRAASIDDIAYWVIHDGGDRPLDGLMSGRCRVQLAYAIAKEAVRYLIELVGEPVIKSMFELRAKGVAFDVAFKNAAGFDVGEFQEKFIKSLKPNYYERAK